MGAETERSAARRIQNSPRSGRQGQSRQAGPESLAKGKKLYGFDCAMCHGESGDGKGDMATDMKDVTDFTKPDALKNRTDGELFYIIRTGKARCPRRRPRQG